MTRTYSHRYRLHGTLCETCRRVEALNPAERRLAEWALLDITVRHQPAAAPQQGLVLVAHPGPTGNLIGRVELQLDGTVVGTVTLTCCPACRSATLDYVHVVAPYRRLGYGRTLVAAARECAPGYQWTAPLPDGVVAQAFRSRIVYPRATSLCVHRNADE
jgi:GNAT superfamily N-acetyltransferase